MGGAHAEDALCLVGGAGLEGHGFIADDASKGGVNDAGEGRLVHAADAVLLSADAILDLPNGGDGAVEGWFLPIEVLHLAVEAALVLAGEFFVGGIDELEAFDGDGVAAVEIGVPELGGGAVAGLAGGGGRWRSGPCPGSSSMSHRRTSS